MRRIFIATLVLMTSCHRDPDRDNDGQVVSIGRRESIHSAVLNEDRPVLVYVPPYAMNSGKKFPVLYLFDGDAHFHSVSGLIQILGTGVNGTNVVPEMIVVAVPNTDRTRDLTPSHSMLIDGRENDFLKSSGGGQHFLEFVETELIPYVESHYPTHPYRVLVGHSFGGIAAINALYQKPDLFDAIVAIDPSFWWDDHLLLKKADTFFSTNKLENKYLFLAQANTLQDGEETNDHFGSIREYEKTLASPKNTSGIKWSYKYYPDDSHGSVPLISEYDGLRFIFKDFNPGYADFKGDPDALKKNFAQYRMPPPEFIVNRFGYESMGQKDLQLAERYFQMNLDAYPKSSNAHDSMGELFLNKGDTVHALKMYEKAVELDGTNDNARRIIRDILTKRK